MFTENRSGNAFTRADFENATTRWFLDISDDVGIATMLTIAVDIVLGFTTILLYTFTAEHMRQYSVLTALGAPAATLRAMVMAQAATAGLLRTSIGIGLCAASGIFAARADLPYRMMCGRPAGLRPV